MLYGGGVGVLLLTTVAGYWVLERAEGHKGSLRRGGRTIGWIVIAVSLAGVACRIASLAADGGLCPTGACPISKKMGGYHKMYHHAPADPAAK